MRGAGRSMGSGFRALFVGSLVSNLGDGVRLAAIPLLADRLTSSAILLAAVTAAQYLAWIVVAPMGGALVDRHDRRRMILANQAWRGLVMLGLAVLVATDAVAIWHLWIVAFLITAGEILVDPSVVAMIPTVVTDEHLDAANGRISAAEVVSNDFAGGPVGSTLFRFSPWLPFVWDGASYLGSLVPFRRLPPGHVRAAPTNAADNRTTPTTLRVDAAEGRRYLRRHPVLWPVTVATMVYYFGAATGFSLLVKLVRSAEDGSATAFGMVLACGAVGAFIGTLLGARLASAFGIRTAMVVTTLVEGSALATLALWSSVRGYALLGFIGGVPAGARIPVARSLQQRLTPNGLLGRVNVTSRMFTRGVIVVGALGSGAVASAVGLRSAFAIGGGIVMFAALLFGRALRNLAPSTPTPDLTASR